MIGLTTPLSLLERLRDSTDNTSWRQLVALYAPLIRGWLKQFGVSHHDADDFVQEVFHALVHEINTFRHNGQRGAFRNWLRMTLVNRLRGYWRTRDARKLVGGGLGSHILRAMTDPSSDPNLAWDREHDVAIARRLLELMEPRFTPSAWQAFVRQVLDGKKPAEVAAELGSTVNAVLIAKSRVLRRFREEIGGLVDDIDTIGGIGP